MPYMNRNREWAMLTRYSNSLWVIMWESSSILNSVSKALKSGITSEMGTLSDWYLAISLSSGTKIMRAPFNLTTNGSLVMTSLTFWHSACCTAVPLMKSLADEIVCRCDSESSKLWYLCWMVPQHVGAGWTSAWALVAFCNSCSCALTTWWLWNNLLENFLAVDNKLQHLLEWKTNRICCLYVASLLSLCCHKGIFDKKMNSTRTALLEVERQEHVMQWYPSLLIGGCVVSIRTSKISGFILLDDVSDTFSNLLVIMPLLVCPHQLKEEGAFQGHCHVIYHRIILNIGPAISCQITCWAFHACLDLGQDLLVALIKQIGGKMFSVWKQTITKL